MLKITTALKLPQISLGPHTFVSYSRDHPPTSAGRPGTLAYGQMPWP